MMHYFERAALALASDAFQTAAEHADAIPQKRAVGRVVDVAFYAGSVDPQFLALGYSLFLCHAHNPLMNLLGELGTEQGKQAAESAVIRGGLGVKVREAPIDQIAAKLSFQSAKTPALEVFQHAAAQQAIGSDPGATGAQGSGMVGGQAAADPFDQQRVIEEVVDRLE
jgi:hypothetical protein